MPGRPRSTLLVIRRLQRALDRIDGHGVSPEAVQRQRAEIVMSELAGIPAAVFVANDRGHYVDVNPPATQLTGYSRSELLRMSVWDLTPARRRGLARRLWREFLSRDRMSGVYELCRKDRTTARPRYVAASNVLPGIHVSAMVTPELLQSNHRRRRPTSARRPAKRRK
jgi:PAS domain S-box-containing protein